MSQRNESSDITLGMLLVVQMHIFAIFICTLIFYFSRVIGVTLTVGPVGNVIGYVLLYAFFGIGLFQLVYIVPVIFWAKSQQRWGFMKGVIIGAVITALLNGGCWLIVTSIKF